ncbi:hypothetical protein [Bradyrhizobium diazoefficiens]|uniref:hypothetical protein n=1 Tax=Bradyrhizobium diazoefficiens TaxID=1355477 RepID=UPI0035959871
MSKAELSIIDEVESALRIGSAEKGLETARRVTDLFLSSAGSFDDEQIALFDEVLERPDRYHRASRHRRHGRTRGAGRDQRTAGADRTGATLRHPPPRQQ